MLRCSMSESRSREFFTDRNLGRQFPEMLAAAGVIVHRHDEYFAQDCPDEEWLAVVGARGWVAITYDRRIRYKPNELQAVIDASATLLVVTGKAPFREFARSFVNSVPAIDRFLNSHLPPLIAKVYRASSDELRRDANACGRVELWYPS